VLLHLNSENDDWRVAALTRITLGGYVLDLRATEVPPTKIRLYSGIVSNTGMCVLMRSLADDSVHVRGVRGRLQ